MQTRIASRAAPSTTRARQAAPIDPMGRQRETDAIVKFLQRNWDVNVKKGSLRALVSFVLEQGIDHGVRQGQAELRRDLKSLNVDVEIANQTRGAQLPSLKLR